MKAQLVSAILVIAMASGASAQSFTVRVGKSKALTASAVARAERETSGVRLGSDKKTITVNGKSGRLVVRTGPKSDMMSYRIKGIRNPTISIPVGAKLQILFVNADDDMLHSLRFTAKPPPFDAKVGNAGSFGSAELSHMKGQTLYGQELSVTAPAKKGIYTYICTIPGHAAAGMYGKLVVR